MFQVSNKLKVHFVGIGGIGMSGIAEVLLSMGYKVSGSDMNSSSSVEKLKNLGAEICLGHRASNVEGATSVVFSSAISPTNPEILYAKEKSIKTKEIFENIEKLIITSGKNERRN